MSFTEILTFILSLLKRYWWLLALIIIPYGCRTIGCFEVTGPLKKDALQIIDIAVNWWNLPEAKGGGGMKPLSELDIMGLARQSGFVEMNASIPSLDEEIAQFSKDSNSKGLYIWTENGSYTIIKLPDKPNHIRMYGYKLTSKFYKGSVRYEVNNIDLSKKNQKIKFKTNHVWRQIWL